MRREVTVTFTAIDGDVKWIYDLHKEGKSINGCRITEIYSSDTVREAMDNMDRHWSEFEK